MEASDTTTLLISTYNKPDFLKLSIQSALRQTVLPTEIVIADDGSTDETYKLINEFKKISSVPIIHVWQPDNGFRAGTIRNIAVAATTGEYIIQIDGDIIMEKHFIEDHLFHKKTNTLLQGSRVFITKSKTEKLISGKSKYLSFFSCGIKRRENALRSKKLSSYLSNRYRNRYPIYYARGCNMSFYRKDFIKANGYNDKFLGWGHEDSELTLRMLNNGCEKNYIKFHCVAYHLYHQEASRNLEPINKQRMENQAKGGFNYCKEGVNLYLSNYSQYIKK